jgi:hypothetical protein
MQGKPFTLMITHERDDSCRHAPKIDRWSKHFDDIWTHQAQKREFRHYIRGLLGESERKNLSLQWSQKNG